MKTKRMKLFKDNISGEVFKVLVNHKQKGIPITKTKEVYFGKIEGEGKEFAFRVPTRFKKL